MSVIDTLLLSAYNFLDSANSQKEEENKKQSDYILSEFHSLDDGKEEIHEKRDSNNINDTYSINDNSGTYKYFTPSSKQLLSRKSRHSLDTVDVGTGYNNISWMNDGDDLAMV
jgi:hypothetical protein